jgi:serine/threonine protein phosphatase 1
MRHLAVGDIHGCFNALSVLADLVPFRPDDVLITLGDYVNRGPDSHAVLDWLIAYKKRGGLVALRGNHEIMMLEARDSDEAYRRWLGYGGQQTLASYSHFGDAGQLADIPQEHWSFLENDLAPWHETKSHIFVHANAYPDVPMAEQPEFALYWEPFADPPAHESGKTLICGHTSQKTGRPRNIGHAVCIDTWAYGAGWLTCLDVGSGQFWQANRSGATRCDWLDNFGG